VVIYLSGSLRTQSVPELGKALRADGYDVFDDWHAAGPRADDEWQRYEMHRGRNMRDALRGYAAMHVFKYDLHHLDRSDVGVALGPIGKSTFGEMVYLKRVRLKPVYMLLDSDPERWDNMLPLGVSDIFYSVEDLRNALRRS